MGEAIRGLSRGFASAPASSVKVCADSCISAEGAASWPNQSRMAGSAGGTSCAAANKANGPAGEEGLKMTGESCERKETEESTRESEFGGVG